MPDNTKKNTAEKDAEKKDNTNDKILQSTLMTEAAKNFYEKYKPTSEAEDVSISVALKDIADNLKKFNQEPKQFNEFAKELFKDSTTNTQTQIDLINAVEAANIKFNETTKDQIFADIPEMVNNLENFLKTDGLKYNFVDVNKVVINLENVTVKALETRKEDNLKKVSDLKLPLEQEKILTDAINKKFEEDKKNIEQQFINVNKLINDKYQKNVNWLNALAEMNRSRKDLISEFTRDYRKQTTIAQRDEAPQDNPLISIGQASYKVQAQKIIDDIYQSSSIVDKLIKKVTETLGFGGQNKFAFPFKMTHYKPEDVNYHAKNYANLVRSTGSKDIEFKWLVHGRSLLPSEIRNLKEIYKAYIEAGFPPEKIHFSIDLVHLSNRSKNSKEERKNPPQCWEDIFSSEELEKLHEKSKNISKSSNVKQKEIWDAIQVKRQPEKDLEESLTAVNANKNDDQGLTVLK